MIIVDDGSVDSTAVIIDNYSKEDHRIRVFHQVNMGWCSACNFAISASKGQYIFSLDSDNWLPNDRCFEKLFPFLIKGFGVIQGAMELVSEGTSMPRRRAPHRTQFRICETGSEIADAYRTGLIWLPSHGGKAILRELLSNMTPVFSGNAVGADTRFNKLVLAKTPSVAILSDLILCVAVREGSLSYGAATNETNLEYVEEECDYYVRNLHSSSKNSLLISYQVRDIFSRYQLCVLKSQNKSFSKRIRHCGSLLYRIKHSHRIRFAPKQNFSFLFYCKMPRTVSFLLSRFRPKQ